MIRGRLQPERAAVRGRRLRHARSSPTAGTGLDTLLRPGSEILPVDGAGRRARRRWRMRRRREADRRLARSAAAGADPSVPGRTRTRARPARAARTRDATWHVGKLPHRTGTHAARCSALRRYTCGTGTLWLSRSGIRMMTRKTRACAPGRRRRRLHRVASRRRADRRRAPGSPCIDNLLTGRAGQPRPSSPRIRASSWSRPTSSMPLPTLRRASTGCFNLACPASPPHYQADPVHTMMTSVAGHRPPAANSPATHGARFLQASTSEVYGDPDVHPQDANPTGATSTRPGRAPATTRASARPRRCPSISSAARPRRPRRPHLQHLRSAHAGG